MRLKNPLLKGDLKGNAAVIYKGGQVPIDKVVVAEGPETAASVVLAVNAIENNIPVLASLSLGNLANLSSIVLARWRPKIVIIAADNDGNSDKNDDAIVKFKSVLEEHNVRVQVKMPKLAKNVSKIDWNDVLVKQGLARLKSVFGE